MRINLKSSWTEPCVIWVAIVGESGTLKSPALSLAMEPLKKLQAWSLAEYPELMEQYKRDMVLFDADKQAWKKSGRAKGEPPPEEPTEPVVRRYIVSDTTIEALAERLHDSPRGLLVCCDELAGWLGSFDRYTSGSRRGDVSRWLSMFRADDLLVDRKSGTKTIFVPRAAVSVVGGIQPDIFRRALGTEHLDNGLAARLLIAMPPRITKRWTDATIDGNVKKDVRRLFGRLLGLSFAIDEDDQPCPIDIPLSSDGKRAWVEFYNHHAEEQNDLVGELAAAWSKLEGYCGRLALIVHLIRVATDDQTVNVDEVDAASIQAGAVLVQWFGNEVRRIYNTFDDSEEDRDTRRLIELIGRNGGEITTRQLQHASRRFRANAEVAERALTGLAEAGFGGWYTKETAGRPASIFRLSTGGDGATSP